MLHLIAFVQPDDASRISGGLAAIAGVVRVTVGAVGSDGLANLTAQMETGAADRAIEFLSAQGVTAEDVSFVRLPVLHAQGWVRRSTSDPEAQVWSEVIARARGNARLGRADLLFMIAAGVIAGVGVLTGSSILVVGAMAISPDILPITATAVGLVQRRWSLATRSLRTLLFGLAASTAAACGATLILRASGRIDQNLRLADTVLGPALTTLGPGTALVAMAAGVAGILAYEQVGGAAVGVAISVTTIPAAAYVGDAIALGRSESMTGALLVLVTNVVLIVASSTVTLWFQRRAKQIEPQPDPKPDTSGS